LIPYLLDAATVPPVAIYAYPADQGERLEDRTNSRSVFFPFCHYSPEYVALKAGDEVGASLGFCDVPAGVTLGWPEGSRDGEGEPLAATTAMGGETTMPRSPIASPRPRGSTPSTRSGRPRSSRRAEEPRSTPSWVRLGGTARRYASSAIRPAIGIATISGSDTWRQ
jgi:hypothetical protein